MFYDLVHHYHAQPDRRGEVYVTCPFCGKPSSHQDVHFSFSLRGYHCFVCGAGGGLLDLARHLGMEAERPRSQHRRPPGVVRTLARPHPAWLDHGQELLARYTGHPHRLDRWQAYKPVSAEIIERFRFGVGVLPGQTVERLIVPLFNARGQLVGLRGRAMHDESPKWISATGSRLTLWNGAGVRPGVPLWICENYVDAALLIQHYPDLVAVATGGAALWRESWTRYVAKIKPSKVVVALDNDLAGQATGALRERLLAERAAQGLPPIRANGPKVANALLRAGLRVHLFRWPDDAPAKADLGWLLMNQQ